MKQELRHPFILSCYLGLEIQSFKNDYIYRLIFVFFLQIHEGFRKIGVGVKDDIAIVTLNKDVDE